MKNATKPIAPLAALAVLAGWPGVATHAHAQDQEIGVPMHANLQMAILSVLHGVSMQAQSRGWETCSGGALQIELRVSDQQWTAVGQGDACGGVFTIDYSGELIETADGYEATVRGFGSVLDAQWHSHTIGTLDVDSDSDLIAMDYDEYADDGTGNPMWWISSSGVLVSGPVGSVGEPGAGVLSPGHGAVQLSNTNQSTTAPTTRPDPPPSGPIFVLEPGVLREDQVMVVVMGAGDLFGNRSNRVLCHAAEPFALDASRTEGRAILEIVIDDAGACYADMDGDGTLSVFDFLAYQNAFATGDPAADCDNDGDLSLFDFLCFQNAFSAGC